ncbi:hypothetical protein EJ04DRAFT_610410 [Polyplosphaeria fusca]|uniref:Uncharacterized protein n=1 Tax=Polyplosphaeria fusca TaxID=682080 RepID=A0A9P4QRV0_9PLEO|nr:hypothetical protein EJ04DRAFT_610410 [Polyplosphaeria fusca]
MRPFEELTRPSTSERIVSEQDTARIPNPRRMEVAGLVLTAVAFVDQAIKLGSALAKLAREIPGAGTQISNAAIRLEAQRYTLKLWHASWLDKAERQRPAPLADRFRTVWGEDGYDLILKCFTQINARFGEALRTMRSIDPDFFQNATPGSDPRPLLLLPLERDSPTSSTAPSESNTETPPDEKGGRLKITRSRFLKSKKTGSERSTTDSLKFWKRLSRSSSTIASQTPAKQKELNEQMEKITKLE